MRFLGISATLLLILLPVPGQTNSSSIGSIDFFGTVGIDVQRIKDALPLHVGDQIATHSMKSAKAMIQQSIKNTIGMEPTDVAIACCDEQIRWVVFIGLPGKNYRPFQYKTKVNGSSKLHPQVIAVYREAMDLILESIQSHASEDNSRGYALSTYPPLRAKQLALHEYAEKDRELIYRVLEDSGDDEQRSVAAELVGYGSQGRQQIVALVRASQDMNEGVRNSAVRALGVLFDANKASAELVPPGPFVAMLNSGIWTDRNKGAFVIQGLTKNRNKGLLAMLQKEASDSLLEMARWEDKGHVDSARIILGRIAGIDEKRLFQLVAAHDLDTIVQAFRHNSPQ